MRVHFIEPSLDHTGSVVERIEERGELSLNELRDYIGGYVEHVSVLFRGRRCSMFVDEEGLLKGLKLNPTATMIYWEATMRRDERSVQWMMQNATPIVGRAVLYEGEAT